MGTHAGLRLRDRRPGNRPHGCRRTRFQLTRTEDLRSHSEERSTVGWIRRGSRVIELVITIALVVDRAVERVGDGDPNERAVRILNRGTSGEGRQRVENEGRGAERSNDHFLGQAHEETSLSVDGYGAANLAFACQLSKWLTRHLRLSQLALDMLRRLTYPARSGQASRYDKGPRPCHVLTDKAGAPSGHEPDYSRKFMPKSMAPSASRKSSDTEPSPKSASE